MKIQNYVKSIPGMGGGAQWGTSTPRIWSGGTLMQMVPQILSYRYKNERSVAFKIRRNQFSAGALPDGGAHDAPPDPLVGWRGDTPPHIPPHSARTHLRRSPCMRPPRRPGRSTPMIPGDTLCTRWAASVQ